METLYNPLLFEWAQKIVLAGGAAFAGIFAWKRYRIADSVLGHDQFREAARALADMESESNNLYFGRTAGVAALAFLASKAPKEYHVPVMRLFEAYMRFPSVYGNSDNVVAPDSSETAEFIRFIEHRGWKQKKDEQAVGYKFGLTSPSPFKIKKEVQIDTT